MMKAPWYQENKQLVARKCYWRPAVTTNTYLVGDLFVIVRDLLTDFLTDCHINGLEKHQLQYDSCHY